MTAPCAPRLGGCSNEEAVNALGPSGFRGRAVDSGFGCLFDSTATASPGALLGEDGEVLRRAFARDRSGPGPVDLTEPGSGAGLVAFRTGFGEGLYPTWVATAPAAGRSAWAPSS
ncbi:DUF4241 domain-containing protein [Kitasatospora cathayae]|uniref:DUF4241 domain-containing protein n=1 Tax=Kitasatospora cathayae TaxID=3004092 RepID=A0ABY7QE05_9ACTN|nr:DUF4241 domain-containing protein [Kitasatospora sp. HUAS 3-15]WBP90847.1 DUF4241 domain-containing protein [Kitasatospora sp. HUAS 3-15]